MDEMMRAAAFVQLALLDRSGDKAIISYSMIVGGEVKAVKLVPMFATDAAVALRAGLATAEGLGIVVTSVSVERSEWGVL